MLREGNFWAVTTKLRLKQTPMTLFSSQTSDSFHFLNNKAFLWNEVTASICQVDISTKISQECGWRGLASRARGRRVPSAWAAQGQTAMGQTAKEPLWHHHKLSWEFESRAAWSKLHTLHSWRVRRSGKGLRVVTMDGQGQAGGSRKGATGPTAHRGWAMSRSLWFRSEIRHTVPDAQCKGQGRHAAPWGQHCPWDWPLKLPYSSHTWNAEYLRQSSYTLRTQPGRGFGFVLSSFLEFGSLYFDLSVPGMLSTQSFFWFQTKPAQFFWKADLHLDPDEDSSSCQDPLIWLLSPCEWSLSSLLSNFETLSSRFNPPIWFSHLKQGNFPVGFLMAFAFL